MPEPRVSNLMWKSDQPLGRRVSGERRDPTRDTVVYSDCGVEMRGGPHESLRTLDDGIVSCAIGVGQDSDIELDESRGIKTRLMPLD
jgi:hypothetical protein